MYHVPSIVAITTALAQGGMGFGGVTPTVPGAIPIDQPTDRRTVAVAGGGSLTVALAAIPAGQTSNITALGIAADDFTNLRVTTRINGVAVAPLILTLGTVGALAAPVPLGAPIVLHPGDVFSILLENLAGIPQNLAARVIGWRA